MPGLSRSVEAIQIPPATAAIPMSRLAPIGSPTSNAARSVAAIGLTVIVFATRVGVVHSGAYTQR